MKPKLTFYTNTPSPYNSDLFKAMAEHFVLDVVYYSKIERGRQWKLVVENVDYNTHIFENDLLGRIFEKFKSDFFLNLRIVWFAIKDPAKFVILGGNYYSPNTYIVLIVSSFQRKKVIWFGEKLLPTSSFTKKFAKKVLLIPLFKSCQAIFCVGQAAVDSYKNYGYKGECHNIPYSINSSTFQLENLDKTKLEQLKKNNNPANKSIILSSGSLIHRKGFDVAISSYLSLPDQILRQSALWILGDGPLREELETLDNGKGEIRFLGFQDSDDLPYFFHLASLFLFCSRYDGWAVVINEALSAGLPIVVSDQVTAAEIITNYKNGFVCESNNVEEFCFYLRELLCNPELAAEISKNNFRLSGNLNSVSMAQKIANLV